MPIAIPGLEQEDIGTLFNTKTYDQYVSIVSDLQQGKCPFCPPDPERNKIQFQNDTWMGWVNPFPHPGTQLHIILIPRMHLTRLEDLSPQHYLALGDIIAQLQGQDLPGGALVLRFGDPQRNAGSIRHLHVNIMVPRGDSEVRIPLCKDPKKINQKRRVVEAFEKMRQAGGSRRALSEEEWELVKDRMGSHQPH
ncbi:MAG: hypothetical protein Q8P45_02055 [Candidatus Harrisonbacteria bacterium]|nr:hypothetical protein [Candidatus Harrisonbacteria bacterium]